MRNLKKILALVLALVMSMSLLATANAFTDDAEIDADYAEAVEVLASLGVLKGYEQADGNYAIKPQNNITRAEVAAIIYRVVTGDVKDAQAKIYASGDDFTDVKVNDWFAGYVGFCANAEYIKGYPDGSFMPNANVTGYEALVMILRALGYGEAGEFVGENWAINAGSRANKLGITENVTSTQLKGKASREVVAEIIFKAIQENQVVYTALAEYELFSKQSLAEDVFGLVKGNRTNIDMWGRPGYFWTSFGANVATIEEIPVATYTTFTAECNIASDAGVKTSEMYDVYTNGVGNKSTYNVVATDTVYGVGAQGQLVEVYGKDRMVVIDTYLARVTGQTAARYDAAGHQIIPATSTLAVYNNATGTSYTISGNKYAVGDYILINIVNGASGALVANKYEIVGLAETMVGAQTILWTNADLHCVNGTNYNDAVQFNLDEAGRETSNHTWYFDQYGNLIGATDIDTIYSYGTIQDIQWINPVGAVGYAQATLVLMDGTPVSKVVYSLAGKELTYWATNGASPVWPEVSTNFAQNYAEYAGKHLYRIEEHADGSVILELVQNLTIGAEIVGADVKTGVSVITDGTTAQVYTNSNTQYLVRVGSSVYTFNAVTGYENIGYYTGSDVTVDYVDVNGDLFAEYVYIIGTPDTSAGKGLFYLTSNQVKTVLLANNVVAYYELTGIVDGVAGAIQIPGANAQVVTDIINAGVGKMNIVTYTGGYVTAVNAGVTSYTNLTSLGGEYTGKTLSSYFTTPNTIGANVTANSTAVVSGTVLRVTMGSNVAAYNIAGATVLGGELGTGSITDKAIYVVAGLKNTAGEYVASTIYVADYAIANPGAGTITPNVWEVERTNPAYEYCISLKKIYTASVTETLGTLGTTFSGNVFYTTPAGDTYALSGYDNMNNMTIAAALANGYTITLSNTHGYWTVVDAK